MKIKSLATFFLANYFVVCCLLTVSYAAQEQVTITTFYPAPNGIYIELRADKMTIGSAYRSVATTDGQLAVSEGIAIGQISTGGSKLRINMQGNPASATASNDYFAVNDNTSVGLELHSRTSLGTPYIDFSRSNADFDARISLVAGSIPTMQLAGNGTNVSFYMHHGHPYGTNPAGQYWGAGCIRLTYNAFSGWTPCPTNSVTSVSTIALVGTSGHFLCCYYQ